QALKRSTVELTTLIARQMAEQRRAEQSAQIMTLREPQARLALDRGEEALARQIAGVIAEAEAARASHEAAAQGYGAQIAAMKTAIAGTDQRIGQLRRRLNAAKANAAMQKAQMLTSE